MIVRRIRKFTVIRCPEGEHAPNKGSITRLVTKPKGVASNGHIVISLGNHGNNLLAYYMLEVAYLDLRVAIGGDISVA